MAMCLYFLFLYKKEQIDAVYEIRKKCNRSCLNKKNVGMYFYGIIYIYIYTLLAVAELQSVHYI